MTAKKTAAEAAPSKTARGDADETLMLPATFDSGLATVSKQEADLAFAVVILRSGKINERQLTRALSDWTVYGNQPLAECLVNKQLISPEDKQRFLAETDRRLQGTDKAIAKLGSDRSQSQVSLARIAHLDSSGRVARLLGMGNSGAMAAVDTARGLYSRFSLIRKIGEGGLGTVWLARDENLRRYVAIKEIRSVTESAAAIARFRREAEVTGRLEHPGIVPIYYFGTDSESGRYFYAMRFLGKQTMHDAITEYHERREAGNAEPLLMHRLLTSFVKLCDSVAHAHSRKVVHRDLKPENVALDNFGQVVLLDWGLAKINDETGAAEAALDTDPDDINESSLTVASQVLGSPMYMAPEQASGRIDDIDERTDVYGLGGILFAILTGQAPHEHSIQGDQAGTMSDLLAAIVGRPPVRAKDIVPSVPPELDAICAKAMEKKQYLRYPSAAAIAEDVERYMAGDQVTAYHEPSKRQLVRWVSAHPKLSQLAGLLAMLVLLTLFVVGYSLHQTRVATNTFRFQQAADIAKELSFNLQSQADTVIGDARFINGLSPVQEIISARRGEPEAIESEAVWKDRLAAIFDGLMRRNESYLAIAFLARAEDVEQVVRTDRNVGAGIVRRVPDNLLRRFPIDDSGPNIAEMLPGDVILQTSDQINRDAPTKFRDALSLTAINAVFDESSGEPFGVVAIQVDLRRLVKDRIDAMGRDTDNVYVTDGSGAIQLFYSGGRVVSQHDGVPIANLFPELARVFTADAGEQSYSDGQTLYATRLRLGQDSSQSQADVGIVVQVAD